MAVALQIAGGCHADDAGADNSNVLGLHEKPIIASGLATYGLQW
jgi:hypothetical protein